MALPIYTQTTIAMVWDFDKTLIPGYSQEPLFDAYGVDPKQFWDEANSLASIYESRDMRVGPDTAYLPLLLSYVRNGLMADLTNEKLSDFGARLTMCPGIPEFLTRAQELVTSEDRYKHHELNLEHYVVSTGIRQLIQGSAVGPHVERIWANEFIDELPPPGFDTSSPRMSEPGVITDIGYMMDNTSKTRALFEINKGPDVPVNALMAMDQRRIPFPNMIYIADGPSDVPVFSLLKKNSGRCLGVHQPDGSNYPGVKQLQDDMRVHSIAPADYTEGTPADLWLTSEIRAIADSICDTRERTLRDFRPPAGHNP